MIDRFEARQRAYRRARWSTLLRAMAIALTPVALGFADDATITGLSAGIALVIILRDWSHNP